MCEHGQTASHTERQGGQNIRPKQLRSREVSWEGSQRSKLMSRRTERPYKVDGTGELARHSAARCSVPEINGPVVQQEFTSLLRETCGRAPLVRAGAAVSNGCRANSGVSRDRSTESNEPTKVGRLTTQEELNLTGRHDHRRSCSGSDEAEMLSYRQRSSWQRKSACVIPQGLSGIPMDREPACPVVWETGRAISPPTRLDRGCN